MLTGRHLFDQLGLEYRRERSCRLQELEVIDQRLCHQKREGLSIK